MKRRTIVGVAIGLALVAGVAPLGVMTLISRQRAVEAEYAHLDDYAHWTLQRADQTLGRAKTALQAIEAEKLRSCTPAHVLRMRQLTMDSRAIAEMGAYRGDRLVCTSWGPVPERIPRRAAAETLPGGYGLIVGVRSRVSRVSDMLVLTSGDHNALVNPEQMVDVLVDARMVLGVATNGGQLIAVTGRADPELVSRLIRGPMRGMDEGRLFVSVRGPELTAFAITERSAIRGRLDRELLVFAPLAILISAVLIGLVIWLSRRRLSPQAQLEEAIREGAFVAYYQPIIELSTGRCVGAEALARWRRADGDWTPPDQFIPLAEQSGLIDSLTDRMIDCVVRDLDAMLGGDTEVHVAINLSARDIETGRFLPVLERALAGTGVQPSQIWLEATERGFINAEAARSVLARARAAGHRVAIDDFGTGYSSLSMLESLPLDALKIDRAFIAAIGRESATSVVTPHIIDMAHSLGLHIVAEGVETRAQEAHIRAAGVQLAQGWLYADALPPEAFAAFYNERNLPEPSAA